MVAFSGVMPASRSWLQTWAALQLQAAALSEGARAHMADLAERLGLAGRLTLHEEAAGTAGNTTIAVNTGGRSRYYSIVRQGMHQ